MSKQLVARVHSVDTFGTVDGPGVRYIIFLQGCPLRCNYCHNPDTWDVNDGNVKTIDEVIADIKKYFPFIKPKGGVTVSGGEPLLQAEFILELFKRLKKDNVHTAIDTSGITYNPKKDNKLLNQVLHYTDLVLLDLKHIDDTYHQELTGHSNERPLAFAKYLDQINKPVWIRHVLVPTITTEEEHLRGLNQFIKTLGNVEKLEVLPYHTMGTYKWEQLGRDYPLKGVASPSKEQVSLAEEILTDIRQNKSK